MIIFVDSNVLISAILNPNGIPYKAFTKAVTPPNRAIICQQNVDELKRIFKKKFPAKLEALKIFLETTSDDLEVMPIPERELSQEKSIRDVNDRPIIRAAIKANADIILTGDKDFLEANIDKPLPMTPAQFLLHTAYEVVNDNNHFVHENPEEYNTIRK